nr:odorant receptor SameORX [Schistocerca americana]
MPAVVWCPFPFTESPAYEAVYAAVSVAMFYGYILTTTLDAFFFTLIIYTAGQLRVLNLMARDLCARGSLQQMNARLADCVSYHVHIERCVQRLGALVGPIVLGQFLADIVTISAATFVATVSEADSVWLLKFSSYLLAIAEQLLLYCWFGSDVATESERLQLAAYSSDWTAVPARFQKDLCILLSRGHRPLRLAAYKFYTISRETFLMLMNTAFSYYAVLRQLNGN